MLGFTEKQIKRRVKILGVSKLAPLLDEFRNWCITEEAEKLYKELAAAV